jgi:hypothetical protein
MKNLLKFNDFIHESIHLNEDNIRDDAKLFLNVLISKGIIKDGYVTSTGYGNPLGKTALIVQSGDKKYEEFTDLINQHYQKKGTTNLSSALYYSKVGKLYFFYYTKSDGHYDYKIIIRRNKK